MKPGWEVRPLGNVLDIQNGFAFSSSEFSDTEGMPLIRIRDLGGDGSTVTKFAGEYDDRYVVRDGDLLIGMDGEFRCHEWRGPDALLNQRVCRLEKFSSAVEPRFLRYGLDKFLQEIEAGTAYTTVKHLSSKQIEQIKFPLPPLEEQQRIVALLDAAFEKIESAKIACKKSAQLTNAVWLRLLENTYQDFAREFPVRRIEAVAAIRPPKREVKARLKNEALVSFVPMAGLREDAMALDTSQARPLSDVYSSYTYFANGDVLLAKITPCFENGKTGVAAELVNGVGFGSSEFMVFRPQAEILPEYLFFHFVRPSFREAGQRHMRGAVGHKRVPEDFVRSVEIPVPPISVQEASVRRLLKIEAQLGEVRARNLATAHMLGDAREGILKMAFAGELT